MDVHYYVKKNLQKKMLFCFIILYIIFMSKFKETKEK